MVFQRGLDLVKKEIERELAGFFDLKQQEAKRISPYCTVLVDQVRDFTMRGGKRTRAFLCLLGFQSVIARSEATRQSPTKTEIALPSERTRNDMLMRAMAALELFQSFALIHDDIIDEDTLRRGGPTVHESFRINALTRQHVTLSNASHYGTSMAILAGDLALVWADELMGEALQLSLRAQPLAVIARNEVTKQSHKTEEIAASPAAPRNDTDTWKLYQRMKQEVIFGQALDVMEEHMKPGIPKELIDIYKTAWYTVIRPIQIGAAIGGANTDTLEAYVPYGLAVGQSYQLRDDFLDGAVREDVFREGARKLQERAAQAIKKLNVSQAISAMFEDFARFALSRQA